MRSEEEKNRSDAGFSLVELVVVVLIMAIIAVALAPQVLKWVNNSRIATDMDLKDSLQEFLQVTVMGNEAAHDVAEHNGVVLTTTNTGTSFKDGDGIDYGPGHGENLYNKFMEISGDPDLTKLKTKVQGSSIVITVSKDSTNIVAQYLSAGGGTLGLED